MDEWLTLKLANADMRKRTPCTDEYSKGDACKIGNYAER